MTWFIGYLLTVPVAVIFFALIGLEEDDDERITNALMALVWPLVLVVFVALAAIWILNEVGLWLRKKVGYGS